MKLQQLFASIPGRSDQTAAPLEVSGVFADARLVTLGSVFVAIRGLKADGHDFLEQAVQNGAAALVVTDRAKVPIDFDGFIFQVEDSRQALDQLASRFYGDPGNLLFCVGVTGTNGKTSITYMVEELLDAGNMPTGVIGTVNHHLGAKVWPSEMTTPDPVFLQKRLSEFKEAGAKAVAIEISSHALDQKRADSVPLNVAIFTNLTRDHLDYHADMNAYFAAKQRLFLDRLWKTTKHPCYAIVNVDDSWGRKLKIADPAVLWTYGQKDADFCWTVKKREYAQTVFDLVCPFGVAEITLPMAGDHNVQNAVAAFAAAMAAGVPFATAVKALGLFRGVPGRLQYVGDLSDVSVFVDYAHSPDALENVLNALQDVRNKTASKSRIWTVFGCGGDRDRGKRPLMLQAALKGSDQVIVTSDNPRTEDPDAILKEIMAGTTPSERVQTDVDRKEAIHRAIQMAAPGDVILIAGKGHEDYQIIGTEKRPFSDVAVARAALGERK